MILGKGNQEELLQQQKTQTEIQTGPVVETAAATVLSETGPMQREEQPGQAAPKVQREELPKAKDGMIRVYYVRRHKKDGRPVVMEKEHYEKWRREKDQEKREAEQDRLREQKRAEFQWEREARRQQEADEEERRLREEAQRRQREEEERRLQEQLRRDFEEQQRIGDELERRWAEENRQREAIRLERESMMPQPSFRQYTPEQLRSLGKIKRTTYHVKKFFWDKKHALCQRGCQEMLDLRRVGQERFGQIQANAEDMERALRDNRREEVKEARYEMAWHQMENWKKFLTGHGLERAYVAVKTYCTFNHSLLVQGNPYEKFQNDELMDAYLQNDRIREQVPRKYFANDRRGVLTKEMMADTDKLVAGAQFAKLPQDTVLCNWMDAAHLAQLLGMDNANLDGMEERLQQNPVIQEKGMMGGMLERGQLYPLKGKVELVILAKTGTRAIPVNGTDLVRGSKDNVDMLLAPGTRLRVISCEREYTRNDPDDVTPDVSNETLRVYVETVPNGGQQG